MTDLAERRGLDADVYQPAEDSRLLASAAVEHVEADDLVVDVGTGSGFVAAALAEETGATALGTDLNPHACHQARERGVEVVRADLVAPIADGVADVVACNPPYLPEHPALAATGGEGGETTGDRAVVETASDRAGGETTGDGAEGSPDDRAAEPDTDWMEVALSGGETGRAMIEDLLVDVGRVLAPGGCVLLLVSSLTGLDEVVDLAVDAGFSVVAVAEDSYPYETLNVLKLVR